MKTFILILTLSFWYLTGAGVSSGQSLQVADTRILGSAIEIDQTEQIVTIQTRQEVVLSLPVAKSELMDGLQVGDHVSLQMDKQGRIITLVKITGEQLITLSEKAE